MQGSFRAPVGNTSGTALTAGAGTDWGAVLTPALDERTQREFREQNARPLPNANSEDSDDSGSGSDAGPDRAMADLPAPLAPPLRFKCKDYTVFVLDGDLHAPLAPLEQGLFLVPHTVRNDGSGDFYVPYPLPARKTMNQDMVRLQALLDNVLFFSYYPDPWYCTLDVHFVVPAPTHLQIGRVTLQRILETAQDLDLRFARRMEGLSNVASSVVWDCLDPSYNPADRQAVMDVFLAKYLQRFFAQVGLMSNPSVQQTVAEGVRRHKEFCKEWVKQHHRALTPYVTGPAEVLANTFYQNMPLNRTGARTLLSCPEMARLFMRHEATSVEFASCLQYFVASIDQTRGARNASYKQMNMATFARNQGMRTFGDTLARALPLMRPLFEAFRDNLQAQCLSEYTVDWHDILAQIPYAHPAFDEGAAFGMDPAREAQHRPGDPPWRAHHG